MRLTLTLPLLAALALPLTGCFDHGDRKKGHGHCGGPDEQAVPANVVNLTRGEWNVVSSASTPTTEVFRPQAEPQRGSHFKYVFAANGNYNSVALDCTSHGTAAGTWALEGNTLTLYPTGGATEVKQIVSISATELQLAR
jgi:Lipocalin-like domain